MLGRRSRKRHYHPLKIGHAPFLSPLGVVLTYGACSGSLAFTSLSFLGSPRACLGATGPLAALAAAFSAALAAFLTVSVGQVTPSANSPSSAIDQCSKGRTSTLSRGLAGGGRRRSGSDRIRHEALLGDPSWADESEGGRCETGLGDESGEQGPGQATVHAGSSQGRGKARGVRAAWVGAGLKGKVPRRDPRS